MRIDLCASIAQASAIEQCVEHMHVRTNERTYADEHHLEHHAYVSHRPRKKTKFWSVVERIRFAALARIASRPVHDA